MQVFYAYFMQFMHFFSVQHRHNSFCIFWTIEYEGRGFLKFLPPFSSENGISLKLSFRGVVF